MSAATAADSCIGGRSATLRPLLAGRGVHVRPSLPVGFQAHRPGPGARANATPDEWHRIHLRNPRLVVPESNMPAYPWLQKTADHRPERRAAHARAADLWACPAPTKRSPPRPRPSKARPKRDALVAYLQGLGVGVRKGAAGQEGGRGQEGRGVRSGRGQEGRRSQEGGARGRRATRGHGRLIMLT
ncbi:cbb3-type cytochrome c oxidase subunit II [Achromobacter xylosoxidans]